MRSMTRARAGCGLPTQTSAGPLGSLHRLKAWALLPLLGVVIGCNPVTTGVKYGVRLVGDVVEDVDVKDRGEALVGQPVAAADQMFGAPLDEFKDVHSERRWRTYPVKLDVLGQQRYVVEAMGGRIVTVSKAEKSGRKVDIPRLLVLKDKVKGKTPRECEATLGFGRPRLEARRSTTKGLVQLYDASMVTDLGTPHYCVARYSQKGLCDDLEFMAVGASTRKDPVAGQ